MPSPGGGDNPVPPHHLLRNDDAAGFTQSASAGHGQQVFRKFHALRPGEFTRHPEGPMSLLISPPDGASRRYDIDAMSVTRDDGAGSPTLTLTEDGRRLVDGAPRDLLLGDALAP